MDSYRYAFNGMESDNEVKGQGNSYNTEFRQYDARVGRWLSIDPMMAKFISFSPYNFVINSPNILNDIKGSEPNVAQSTTVEEFISYLKANKLVTCKEIYFHFKQNSSTVPRYIYSVDNGWIDMNHVFSVIVNGKIKTDLLEPLSGDKFIRDNLFDGAGATSYYSYEDLPSNKYGEELSEAIFDIELEFDLKLKGNELYKFLQKELLCSGAVTPEEAPNFDCLPQNSDRRAKTIDGQVQVLTKKELKTGIYVPQNFSDEPYDLEKFPCAPDSNNAKAQKLFDTEFKIKDEK